MSNINDFVIENGVLKKYRGPGGDVVIPDGVTSIGNLAFIHCRGLKNIVIPQSVTELGKAVISDCDKLELLWVKNNVYKNVSPYLYSKTKLLLALGEGDAIRFYAATSKAVNTFYRVIPSSLPLAKAGSWDRYDLELINNGPEFSYRLPARLLGAVDRLRYPVELTSEAKGAYIDLLTVNVKKVIPWAEYFNCPWIIKLLIDEGVINDENRKAVNKLLKASANPEIAAFAESK